MCLLIGMPRGATPSTRPRHPSHVYLQMSFTGQHIVGTDQTESLSFFSTSIAASPGDVGMLGTVVTWCRGMSSIHVCAETHSPLRPQHPHVPVIFYIIFHICICQSRDVLVAHAILFTQAHQFSSFV